MMDETSDLWCVYDSCAEWCAKRGLKGEIGDPLPNLLPSEVHDLINEDPEAFASRVRQTAYALARGQSLGDFESEILRAMHDEGWLAPETEDAVKGTEKELGLI